MLLIVSPDLNCVCELLFILKCPSHQEYTNISVKNGTKNYCSLGFSLDHGTFYSSKYATIKIIKSYVRNTFGQILNVR